MQTILINELELIYYSLYTRFMQDYKGHFVDDYEGQNKLNREAVKFAVANTVKEWKETKCWQMK